MKEDRSSLQIHRQRIQHVPLSKLQAPLHTSTHLYSPRLSSAASRFSCSDGAALTIRLTTEPLCTFCSVRLICSRYTGEHVIISRYKGNTAVTQGNMYISSAVHVLLRQTHVILELLAHQDQPLQHLQPLHREHVNASRYIGDNVNYSSIAVAAAPAACGPRRRSARAAPSG